VASPGISGMAYNLAAAKISIESGVKLAENQWRKCRNNVKAEEKINIEAI
jgi:hypothetical protein